MVSRYILDIYSPIIPRHNSCTPPKKTIIQASDGHPATGSEKSIALMKIKSIATTPTPHRISPNIDAMERGVIEYANIPSIEYLNNFQKDHFVSPALRY